jgi:hypothetical protein
VLEDATILIPVAELSDELALKIMHRLKSETFLLSIRRRQVLHYSIPKGTLNYESSILFAETGTPCRVVFAFVSEKAYFGQGNLNPYNFLHNVGTDASPCIIERVRLLSSGTHVDGLELSDKTDVVDYARLFMFNEQKNTGTSNSISWEAFRGGFFFVVYDLSSSLGSGNLLSNPLIRQGQYKVVIKFSCEIPQNVMGLAYAGNNLAINFSSDLYCLIFSTESPACIQINSERTVSTNYLT